MATKQLKTLTLKNEGGEDTTYTLSGTYPDLIAGSAEQITTNIHESDSVPYLFRPTPYNSTRESGDIVGASVAWNQIVAVSNIRGTGTDAGVTFTKGTSGDITITGTTNSFTNHSVVLNLSVIQHHKYFLTGAKGVTQLTFNSVVGFKVATSTNGGVIVDSANTGTNAAIVCYLDVPNETQVNETIYPQVTDLTLALGSAIADYIYNLESGTAGAGIAKLREWGFFTKPYYAYNAGGIESVNVSKHIMRDGDNNIIGEYPLDYSLTLRGILKLDGSNNLYADGDTYEADGTVTRKFGIVDLGTLDWAYRGPNYANTFSTGSITNYKHTTGIVGIISKYTAIDNVNTISGVSQYAADKIWAFFYSSSNPTSSSLYIKDTAYTDKNTFASAMSGVYLVYELATPTTETADPYTEVQVCSPYGTEEFVDAGVAAGTRDVAIPVGNVTAYMKNIVGAIEGIPLPPSANGTYTLKVTVASGVPTYSWVSE